MSLFGLVGSDSKSDEQIWQQQLTATDQGTAIRAAGSVTGVGGKTVTGNAKLNEGISLTTGGKSTISLSIGDTSGASTKALSDALQGGLAQIGSSIGQISSLAESKQTGGMSTYLRYVLWGAAALAVIFLLPKLLKH